jgi:endonuclease/exonuclease/phosphatase family metal-dependent hydrolase
MARIASFNVENLFARPKAFRSTDFTVAEPMLAAYREVNALMKQANYSAADKARMRELLVVLDIYYRNSQGAIRRRLTSDPEWAWLRKNRGEFDVQPQDTAEDVEITANGAGDWIGWVELALEATNELGTRMTARVVQDVNADILGIVEAEDRPSLLRFNETLLNGMYEHVMLIDGNDERGIDVAVMARNGFHLERIRSNVDYADGQGQVFSRDCPQYELTAPSGALLHVLVNHFKSQSGGGGAKRRRQAQAARAIVDGLVAQGQHVVVVGDFNEGPSAGTAMADNLRPLYENNSPLIDCFSLPGFAIGNRPGTYDSAGLSNRLDYIFISQSLRSAYTGGGVFRTGVWGGRVTRPDAWATYPEMTRSVEQASDHAAVFVDLNL